MNVIRIDADKPEKDVLHEASRILARGGLVAFPTETVYGLGAHALDPDAVARIFSAKGRPSYNPLIVHIADIAAARALAAEWPDTANHLAEAFWPGPLTLVVPKRPEVPGAVTAGLPTVALRAPAHPIARALLAECRLPLAAPSANPFTALSPTTALHVADGLGDNVDMILDGGPTQLGIESAVVDLSGPSAVLLRPGSITVAQLEAVVGTVKLAPAPIADDARPSPGMSPRHYSPRATLQLFEPSRGDRAAAAAAAGAERRVGALLIQTAIPAVHHPVRMPDSPDAYARELYSALHRLDALGCDMVLVEQVPDGPEWAAIRDRLTRAAHPA
jgi:L-threonylcarbamoyladenylate synthase